MMKSWIKFLGWMASFPALIIGFFRRIAQWIATKRWYLFGLIPCSAGLWPLGLYCWEKPIDHRLLRFFARLFSYICFFFGTFLFFVGLWRFALILLAIRLLIWADGWLRLGDPLCPSSDPDSASDGIIQGSPSSSYNHPLDKLSLLFIGVIFLVFAVNKERLIAFTDPSDHFYHMAVAQKILERGTIPLWDDWEFAPMGRPHLYPPVVHLLIAFFAGSPDNMLAGFSTLQMLLYPLALLSYWILFRALLTPAHAFLSLLVLSMEFFFAMGCLMGLPSSIVNVLWPFIILSIHRKRTYPAMILLAIGFYTHTGIPSLICLSLLIWGIWKREHLMRIIAVIAGALVLAIPWFVRYYVFSDWMHAGGAQGYSLSSILSRLMWLQMLNPLFLILTFWGFFRLKNSALFKSQILGFLPMLTQYGGRFFMHGAPFLSPFIACHFTRFLEGNITRRRAVGFLLLTLIPLPCIKFMGPNDTVQIGPFPGITATHLTIFYTVNRSMKDRSEIDSLTRVLRETTSPDDIIHCPDEGMYHFGDLLVVMTGRRTDIGGWGEVGKPEMFEAIMKSREDIHNGVFLSKYREKIPEGRQIKESGSYFIGYPPAPETTTLDSL